MTDDWRLTTAALTLAASAACAHHYTTTGLVLHVQKPGASVTISHDAFPGFMDAMAMPFDLEGAARRVALTPGDRVTFRLAVKRGRSWVDRLHVISAAPADAASASTSEPSRWWRAEPYTTPRS